MYFSLTLHVICCFIFFPVSLINVFYLTFILMFLLRYELMRGGGGGGGGGDLSDISLKPTSHLFDKFRKVSDN